MVLADHAAEVRNSLTNPRQLCQKLNLLKDAKMQAGDGALICCPSHGERNPSCSVTRGPDGTIRVKCFGCDWSTDCLGLIAKVHGLVLRGAEFREVLAIGASLAGNLMLRDEILAGNAMPDRQPVEAPAAAPPPEYPPQTEVAELWESAVPVEADPDAWEALRSRGIDPQRVQRLDLARSLPVGTKTPPWASYRRQTWVETGHRLLVPMWDARGELRSVRAWRIEAGDSPKRLPPTGHRATDLVMADPTAQLVLRGLASARRLLVVEGEPDTLSAATTYADAVIGLISGSWGTEFAARIAPGTEVILATHNDDAGDRYAEKVAETLQHRCPIWRAA